MERLQAEFKSMLSDDKVEDMKRFYNLLSRIEGGLDNSATTMKEYLTGVGKGIVEEQARELSAKSAIKKSIQLITRLIELHDKYNNVIKDCFDEHKLFVQSMDDAFRKFINRNVGVFTMSELLNFYVDHLLRGLEKLSEDKLEERTEAAVRIFTYFDDKDFFYASYRKSLSKRLLSRNTLNESYEQNFIAKLKRKCGDVYTKKLEGMFSDIKTSAENKAEFTNYCASKAIDLPVDINVQVLNDLYWPLSKQTDLNLPPELSLCVTTFESYFKQQNEKKKLTWLYNQGSVSIIYTFPVSVFIIEPY